MSLQIKIREIDPNSDTEIQLVAQRMRQTLIEVLGDGKGGSMYTMDWLIERVRWHLDPQFLERRVSKVVYNTAHNHMALIHLFKAHGYQITHSESEMVQLTKILLNDGRHMPEIEIKRVKAEYAKLFRDCLDEVARERKYLLLLSAPPLERMEEILAGHVRDNIPQFFAFSGNQIIGWCDIRPFQMPTIDHRAEMGMGVRKAFRGRGIGKMLLQTTMDAAKDRGIEKADLEVFADNESAIALYKDLGFIEEGRIRKFRKIDGAYQDSIWMGKFL